MEGYYHFRCNGDTELLKSIVMFSRSNAEVLFCASEISKKNQKMHFHMLMRPTKTVSTFRQKLLKSYPGIKGNKSYSLEELKKDVENNMIYICKGTRQLEPVVLYYGKYTHEQVIGYWIKYWSDKPIQNEIVEQQTHIKKVRVPSLTWSEKLTAELRVKYAGHPWDYIPNDIVILIREIMKALGKTSKKLSSFIVRDLVLGQLNALTYGECKTLERDIFSNAFPNMFGSYDKYGC